MLAYAWDRWKTNLVAVVEESYHLCFAYRWLGQKKTYWVGLPGTPGYKPGDSDDLWVVEKLWHLLEEADIVIAHNGDGFDNKKSNNRFLYHRLGPPSSYQSIDTLAESRRYFKNSSNRLGDLTNLYLEGLTKYRNDGIDTWIGCMAGDEKAWATMKKYNRHDVDILEAWYLLIRPWIGSPGKKAHPNLAQWRQGERACPKCGSLDLVPVGLFRRTHVYTEWRCGNCGGTARSRLRTQEMKPYEVKLR